MSRTLEFIPIAKVVANGDNPRTSTDEASLEELVESIKRHGVLQPVLVDEPVKGKYHLQAGARRLAAAKKAGLKEIPAQIGKVDDGALTAALTENVLREDLTPLEEAVALKALQEQAGNISARELAKRLGKSNDWVSDRLRLNTLPAGVQDAIGKGELGLHGVPALARIAEASPKAAEAVAGWVAEGEIDNWQVEDQAELGSLVAHHMKPADSGLFPLGRGVRVSEMPIPDAGKLSTRYKRARKVIDLYESEWLSFDQDDVDAARAFGCLLELGGVNFVNDFAWLADRVALKVEYSEREAEKKSKGAKPSAATSAGEKSDEGEKEKRRKEREKEAKARITARGHNLDLGVKSLKTFKAPKLSADVVRLLAELALEGRLDAAFRGLRYVDERLQTVETLKNGSQKITYADSGAAAKLLRADLDKAKTPEEIAGVVIRAMVAARYASQDVIAQSQRSWWSVPGTSGSNRVGKLLDKIAARVVPPALKKGRGR